MGLILHAIGAVLIRDFAEAAFLYAGLPPATWTWRGLWVHSTAAKERGEWQAPGAVSREDAGRQRLPGERRVCPRGRQDLRGEPANCACCQGQDVRETTRRGLTPRAGLCLP